MSAVCTGNLPCLRALSRFPGRPQSAQGSPVPRETSRVWKRLCRPKLSLFFGPRLPGSSASSPRTASHRPGSAGPRRLRTLRPVRRLWLEFRAWPGVRSRRVPLTFVTCGPGACTAAGCSSLWPGVLGDCPHGPGTGRPWPAVSFPQWQFPRGQLKPNLIFILKYGPK